MTEKNAALHAVPAKTMKIGKKQTEKKLIIFVRGLTVQNFHDIM